jgi:hypothetical protein
MEELLKTAVGGVEVASAWRFQLAEDQTIESRSPTGPLMVARSGAPRAAFYAECVRLFEPSNICGK